VEAPARLEAKIRAEVREQSGRKEAAWSRYFLPAAAALALMVGTVAYQLGHLRMTAASQERYIASISEKLPGVMRVGLGDHVHCAVFRKFPANPPGAAEMAEKLGPEYAGLLPIVQERIRQDLKVVLAHTCRYHGRRFVHLALKGDGKLLSVVIARKAEGEGFAKEELAPALMESGIPMYRAGVQRFEIAGFESRDHLVYVVSDLPEGRNAEILTALGPEVRAFLDRVKG
jgi:hypothetical protein